jgi:hypothetical protein
MKSVFRAVLLPSLLVWATPSWRPRLGDPVQHQQRLKTAQNPGVEVFTAQKKRCRRRYSPSGDCIFEEVAVLF